MRNKSQEYEITEITDILLTACTSFFFAFLKNIQVHFKPLFLSVKKTQLT